MWKFRNTHFPKLHVENFEELVRAFEPIQFSLFPTSCPHPTQPLPPPPSSPSPRTLKAQLSKRNKTTECYRWRCCLLCSRLLLLLAPLLILHRCCCRRRRCRHHRCRLYSEWLSTPTTARETIPASDYDEKQKQVEEVKSKERSRQVKKSVLLFLLVSEQQQQQATWLIV